MSYSDSKIKRHYSNSYHRVIYEDGHSSEFRNSNAVPVTVSRSGSAVPNYASKIANREDASSSYTRNDFKVIACKPHRFYARNDRDEVTSGAWNWLSTGTPSLPSTLDMSALEAQALKIFYQNLAEVMTQFESIPFLKEFSQTKQLLRESASRVLDSVMSFGRSSKEYAAKLKRRGRPWAVASKDLGSRWLEYQFGLKPLLMDVEGLSSALLSEVNPVTYVRGQCTQVTNVTSVTTNHSAYTAVWRSTGVRVTTSTVRYVAGLKIQPSVSSRLGLSLRNIPGAIWEITPWSFLVDYFVDVQGFLTSQTYGSLPAVYVSKSTCRKLSATYTTGASPNANAASVQGIISTGLLKWQSYRYTRSPLLSLPFYVPTVNICGPVQGLRGFNVAALLAQKIDPW